MTKQLESQHDAIAQNAAVSIYDRIAAHQVTDVESYILLGELTKEVKKVLNKFEEETRPEIDQAHKLHKALIARKKKWSDMFEEAEQLAKLKLESYCDVQTEAGIDLPKLDGISFSEVWVGEITDSALIPREYLSPDLKKLEGVTKSLKSETSIPGWKVRPVRTTSVRA